MKPDPDFNEEDVRFTFRFLGHKHETEVRLIDPNKKLPTKNLFAKSEDEFVKICYKYNGSYNVYAGINERKSGGTKKDDVVSVNAICFDFDPVRDKTKPANEAELNLARQKALGAAEYLKRERGLYAVMGESGNGGQLWSKLHCEVTDANRDIVEENLVEWQRTIIELFKGEHVDVDNIGDLPRVIKVIGTKSIKGEATTERPHRVSKWVDRPTKVPDPDKIWSEALTVKRKSPARDTTREDAEEQEDLNLGRIIEKCKWLKHCRKDSKNLTEREWLGMLGISARCKDGRRQSHLLSENYPTYNPRETDDKIKHALDKAGPQTCDYVRAHFPKENPGKFCLGCTREVTSPIQLGRTQRKRKGIGNTDDVDVIIAAGLYNRELAETVPAYDQINDAIKKCVEQCDEKTLWTIARAAPHIGVPTLTRYAAQEAILIGGRYATEDLAKPEIYHYDPKAGIYRGNGRAHIARLVNRNIPDASSDLIATVILKVQTMTPRTDEEFITPDGLVCVRNGVFDLNQGILLPHSPDWIFLSRLYANYDPKATCPGFEKFLIAVLLSEDIRPMEEAIGYFLKRGMPYHVIFFLLGPGRNGKTTLFNVLRKLLGKNTYSAMNMQALSTDRFACGELYGKMANISGEVSDKPLNRTGLLKELSGGDAQDCPRKFLSPIRFANEAKLWFAANAAPFTPDITLAWWSRIIIFEFWNTFMRGEPGTDPFLLDKLTTDEELSGILNLAIRGLKRLIAKGDFSYRKTPDDVQEIWSLSSDPVHAWREERCEEGGDDPIPSQEIYADYVAYCDNRRVHPLRDNKFFSALRKECPGLRGSRLNIKGTRLQAFYGLTLKGRMQAVEGEQQNLLAAGISAKMPEMANNPDRPTQTDEEEANGQGSQGRLLLSALRGTRNEDSHQNTKNNDAEGVKGKTTLTTLTKGRNSDKLDTTVRVDPYSPPENRSPAPIPPEKHSATPTLPPSLPRDVGGRLTDEEGALIETTLDALRVRVADHGNDVDDLKAALDRVVAIADEGRRPTVNELYQDLPACRDLLETFGGEIVPLAKMIRQYREHRKNNGGAA